MKKSMIGLSILAVGLLSACQKDDVTTEQGGNAKGKTYAALSLQVNDPLTRAGLADVQADGIAKDVESSFTNVYFKSTAGDNTMSLSDFAVNSSLYTLKAPFQVNYRPSALMAISLNKEFAFDASNPRNTMFGTVATENDGANAEADIETLATDNAFAMTSTIDNNVLEKGVDKESSSGVDGITKTVGDKNKFNFELERVVCKGIVRFNEALTNLTSSDKKVATTDGQGTISLDAADVNGVTFSAVNGATKTYAYKSNAGERTLTVVDGVYKYKDFKSAVDDVASPILAPKDAFKGGFIRLGVIGETTKFKGTSKYAAQAVQNFDDATQGGERNGIYFMENSWANFDKGVNGYLRLASAKIYATYTPKSFMKVEYKENGGEYVAVLSTSTDAEHDLTDGTFYTYGSDVFATKDAALVYLAQNKNVKKAKDELNDVILPKVKEDGNSNGVAALVANFFKTNADDADLAVYTYGKGRCGYYALWNRQLNETGNRVAYGDTRRNNVYLLTIDSFAKLGFPWDPADDEDPNLPKPEDDPKPGIVDHDVNPSKTYITVTCKVLDWNVVNRDVTLQ